MAENDIQFRFQSGHCKKPLDPQFDGKEFCIDHSRNKYTNTYTCIVFYIWLNVSKFWACKYLHKLSKFQFKRNSIKCLS